MRELILAMSMSLDGFVAGPEGEAQWVFNGDQEAIAWKVENLRNVSLHIMGSRPSGHGRPGAGSWAEAYVASGGLAHEIAKLKAKDGKPIITHGGAACAYVALSPRTWSMNTP